MITSQKQLISAKEKIKILKESLAAEYKKNVPEVLKTASSGQIKELISEIESEIFEYEKLKTSSYSEIPILSLLDLMEAPIRYRIAKGMTIEDFARKVHIHSRQIARYEMNHYHNANTDTLLKILTCLDVKISGKVDL
jgi:DNA-binding XRE family transcriptional regulator